MKTIALWSEGYRATCEHGTATYHGMYEAEALKDAVAQFALSPECSSPGLINLENDPPTYWGCRFFDNETDARKSFG